MPEPVGAEISAVSPARMCGQPSICDSVAVPNRAVNHSATTGCAHCNACATSQGASASADSGKSGSMIRILRAHSPLLRSRCHASFHRYNRAMDGDQQLTAEQRAQRIRLMVFDVDGVLTDGGIWLFPAPAGAQRTTAEHAGAMEAKGGYAMHSTTMLEAKGFHAHDGSGVSLARLGGIECAIITKRISEAVALRARDMRLKHVYQGTANKIAAVHEILAKEGLTLEQTAYLGDDVIDLPVMRACGLAMAVADARPQVKAAAHWIAPSKGGRGAGRDAIDFLLEAQGTLDAAIEAYIAERNT